jgi:5-formyltetrahydrofolate cyclo-ligase
VLKDQLRKQARLRRVDLAKAVGIQFGANLVDQFFLNFAKETLTPGINIAGYWPIFSEADAKPLLNALHQKACTCFLPVVVAHGSSLIFREWQPGDELVTSDIGILEPDADKPVGVPDILLLPLLAYDKQGYRMGYGGGYYDRTLSDLRDSDKITAIGIAYAGQEVNDVPYENFDQRLDWVLTEKGAQEF